jgi:hypothetical protein
MRRALSSASARLVTASLLSACGAVPAVPAVAPVPVSPRCSLVGTAPVELTVAGFPGVLEVGRPATYTFRPDEPLAEVRAETPLALAGTAPAESVPLRLRTSLRVHGLGIEGGVRASEPEVVGVGVETTLDLDGLLSVRLAVACNALALGPSTVLATVTSHAGSPTHAIDGPLPLALAATAGGAPFATLLSSDGAQFRVVGSAGGYARIVRELDHGTLDAWVDAARLVQLAPGTGWTMWGSSSCGGCGGVFGRGRRSGIVYEGPATLRRGALVHGEDDLAWARATVDVRVYVAIVAVPDAPVDVWQIDGITSGGRAELPSGITVSRRDLVLPAGALPPPGP